MMADTYTVKSGDSWESIAGKVYGNQRMFLDLMQANGGMDLHPGVVITLPAQQANKDIFISNKTASSLGMATTDQLQAAYAQGMTGKDLVAGGAPVAKPLPPVQAVGAEALYAAAGQAAQKPPAGVFSGGSQVKSEQGASINAPAVGSQVRSEQPAPQINTSFMTPQIGGNPLAPNPALAGIKNTQTTQTQQGAGNPLTSAQAKVKSGQVAALTPDEWKALQKSDPQAYTEANRAAVLGIQSAIGGAIDKALGYKTDTTPNPNLQPSQVQAAQVQKTATDIQQRMTTGTLTMQDQLTMQQWVAAGVITQQAMDDAIAQNNDAKQRGLGGGYQSPVTPTGTGTQSTGGAVNAPTAAGYYTPSGNFVPYNMFSKNAAVGMKTLEGGTIGPNGTIGYSSNQGQPQALQDVLGQGWGNSGLTTGLTSWRTNQ